MSLIPLFAASPFLLPPASKPTGAQTSRLSAPALKNLAGGTPAPSSPPSSFSHSLHLLFSLLFLLLSSFASPLARAQQAGDFTYTSDGSAITITGYTGTGGAVAILGTVAGLPVRTIADDAFWSKTALISVTIPNSVTSIGRGAFYSCTGLISVTIPDSVTSIGGSAFYSCTGLTSVTIGSSVSSIGNSVFWDCTGLTSVTIPDSVTSIGRGAFYSCTGLTSVTIPDSVTSIGEKAFEGCAGLTSVTIGNSVTSIGNGVFAGCTALPSIEVAADNTDFCGVDGVLFNAAQTTLIQYPGGKSGSYAIPNSVTSIESQAFFGCTGLTSVTIPNSVTSIGNEVFAGCRGLTNVTIGNSVTAIKNSAFYGCRGLTSVTIPDSVTSIESSAFDDCRSLTNVTIGNNVNSIGNDAFWGCRNLISVTFEGNAPASFGYSVFNSAAPDFTLYYYEGRAGFTSPAWKGYPAEMLEAPSVPTLEDWRQQHFGAEATNSGDAADDADPDGDGFTNAQEYAAGTDPKNAGSQLQVETATKTDATYTLTFAVQPGRRYELQRWLVVPGATWEPVTTLEPQTTAGSLSLTDPAAPADAALYRVQVTLP